MSTQIKRLDLTKPSFMANGKEYFFDSSFTIERYKQYQIYEKELAYSMSIPSIHKSLTTAFNQMNSLKFGEVAVLLHNLLKGIEKVNYKDITALKLCALFINTKDEDRSVITDLMIEEKINDWSVEGYDIQDFFTLATSTIKGYLQLLADTSQLSTESQ